MSNQSFLDSIKSAVLINESASFIPTKLISRLSGIPLEIHGTLKYEDGKEVEACFNPMGRRVEPSHEELLVNIDHITE